MLYSHAKPKAKHQENQLSAKKPRMLAAGRIGLVCTSYSRPYAMLDRHRHTDSPNPQQRTWPRREQRDIVIDEVIISVGDGFGMKMFVRRGGKIEGIEEFGVADLCSRERTEHSIAD